jgi:protocatechuate 3,4-dioxygenase beta subunit
VGPAVLDDMRAAAARRPHALTPRTIAPSSSHHLPEDTAMQRRPFVIALLSLPLLPVVRAVASGREPVIGACDGCEAVFAGLPSKLHSHARIAAADEPGEPLTLTGIVTDLHGRPQPDVVIYAYHTDQGGIYPPGPGLSGAARRHGRLRGWARTDADGRYRFDSIRPGAYPDEDVPEHIHMHVIEPGYGTYYLDDVMFRDDPKLTEQQIRRYASGRGGDAIVMPERRDGSWWVRRDIVLGRNVDGYRPRGRA